jgi:hypothetical protein
MSDKENMTVGVTGNTEPGNGKVSNVLIWILAFIPAIGALFEFGTLLFLVLNILLCILDEKNLKKAGYNTESLGSVWLIPVYLYKRARYLKHSLAYFIVWCVAFGLSFLGFFD